MNPAELYAGAPSIRQGDDGNWYHYPTLFMPKLLFLLFSLLIFAGLVLTFGVSWLTSRNAK